MAFNIGVGDIIAVTRMAWSLYHDCLVVARNAPDDFRQLVNELSALETVLKTVRDDVTSNQEYLNNLGEARRETLQRCIAGSHDCLKRVEKLVLKYRKIANSDNINMWQRIKWTTHQSELRDLRNRVMVHSTNLNLCISSMSTSSLVRIEIQMMEALAKQDTVVHDDPLDTEISEMTLTDAPVTSPRSPSLGTVNTPPVVRVLRSSTDATIPNNVTTTSPTSSPSMSDDGRGYDAVQMSRQRSAPPMSKPGHTASFSASSSSRPFSSSPRSSQDLPLNSKGGPGTPDTSVISESQNLIDTNTLLDSALADAKDHLLKARRTAHNNRPLRYPPRDELHQPDERMKSFFEKIVEREVEYWRPNARDWLRLATWWLLKARNEIELDEPPNEAASPHSDGASRTLAPVFNQAYVNLLKVSWILYDKFLQNEDLVSQLQEENGKLFFDCSHGLKEDLVRLQPADIPSQRELHSQNLNIWEEVQSEENDDGFSLGLDNRRWISVEAVGAGEEGETVLFRTFVDAIIGPRSRAVHTRGRPYLLLLSSQEGESEPKVTLCNQSGTLGVTRDFTPVDLFEQDGTIQTSTRLASRTYGTELVSLDFGDLKVKVSFSNSEDLSRFMSIPKRYFEAVGEREPRRIANATETLIFRSPVETFEVLQADTMKPTNPAERHPSCDLRILETTGKEGWRTTRRLVLSSSVGHKRPWSKSYFLPLTRVQLHMDSNSRCVKAKWSDCNHELRRRDGRVHTDGNYNKMYTFVYDEANPNQAVELSFRTQADARDFETAVLSLSLKAQYQWSTGSNRNYIYMMQDAEPSPKEYKGMVIQHTRTHWKHSEFYFMYRDSDYDYNHERLTVFFPQLYSSNYVSTHVEELSRPSQPVKFSHCEKKIGNCSIEFDNETIGQEFMSALTQSHKLLFSRRIDHISNKKPSKTMFGQDRWRARGETEVQIWRKGQGFRLMSRWTDRNDKDRWVTLSLPRQGIDAPRRGSNLITLPATEYERGRKVDMAHLKARDPKDPKDAQGEAVKAPFTLSFKSFKDREDFVTVLNGTAPDTNMLNFNFQSLV